MSDDEAPPFSIRPVSVHGAALEVRRGDDLPSGAVVRIMIAVPDCSGWLHADVDVEHARAIAECLRRALAAHDSAAAPAQPLN